MGNLQPGTFLHDDPRAYQFFASMVSLTTSYAEGHPPNVMANEWVFNVSWQPLRIMIIISDTSLTYEFIRQSEEFGVNLCSMEQAHLSHYAGSVSGRDTNKLAHAVFAGQTYPATHIKPPLIDGCVLNAECILEETVKFGDHTGFIGQAISTRINPKLRPLIYTRKKYFFLGNQVPKTVPVNV